MKTAKIFKTGRSQAVRLPKEFQMEGDEAYINKFGNSIVLTPMDSPWLLFDQSLSEFTDDFMNDRKQPMIKVKSQKK